MIWRSHLKSVPWSSTAREAQEDAQGVGVGVEGAGDVGADAAVAALGEGFCGGWFWPVPGGPATMQMPR